MALWFLLCRFSVDPVVMNLHEIEKLPIRHELPTDNGTDSDLGKRVFVSRYVHHLFHINNAVPFNQSSRIFTLLSFKIVLTMLRGKIDKRIAVLRSPVGAVTVISGIDFTRKICFDASRGFMEFILMIQF